MDLLFENQTQTTKKLLEEFTKETYYAFNKKTRIVCLIMFIVEFFAFILGFIYSGFNFSMRLSFLLFLSVFFLFFISKGMFLSYKKIEKV